VSVYISLKAGLKLVLSFTALEACLGLLWETYTPWC
jgi:hypothetical protein